MNTIMASTALVDQIPSRHWLGMRRPAAAEDKPPLPVRPPNPGRHDRDDSQPQPGLSHPQLSGLWQCSNCGNWSPSEYSCPDCGALRSHQMAFAGVA